MGWLSITVLGACGGAVVQALVFTGNVQEWQYARRKARERRRRQLPRLTQFVDLPADTAVFATRLALGALAGFLFHSQVTGATAAVAVGASAPALLRQLGTLQSAAGKGHDDEPDE